MSSIRTQIRENIVDRLKVTIPEAGGRVFNARAEHLGDVELPCICIYTRSEEVETLDNSPTIQTRTLSLAVEIVVSGSGSIDDDLDELSDSVESELLTSGKQSPASGLYQSATLTRTDVGFLDTGRKPIGAARLTFDFSYQKTFI